MTKTNRETAIIAVIGSSIGGLIVALIMFSFTKEYDSEEYVKKELIKKVDKVEYVEKCKEINQKINTKVDKDVFEMSQRNIDIFISNQLIIQADIKEMLKK